MRSFNNDMSYGLQKENEFLNKYKSKLCELFSEDDIKNTKELYNDGFCKYDFEGLTNKIQFELKSRRVKKGHYPTTIIPVHKLNDGTKQVYIFQFTDGCFYIEYNKELFYTFQRCDISTTRLGKYDRPTPHFLIPINLLIPLD